MTPAPADGDYAAAFERAYQVRAFGAWFGRVKADTCAMCMCVSARVESLGSLCCHLSCPAGMSWPPLLAPYPPCHVPHMPLPQREFGFKLEGRGIVVDDLRVRASGRHVELPDSGEVAADPGARFWHLPAAALFFFDALRTLQ